jgi:hypothetical protein
MKSEILNQTPKGDKSIQVKKVVFSDAGDIPLDESIKPKTVAREL